MILVLIESQEAAGDDEVQQLLQGSTGPAFSGRPGTPMAVHRRLL
jgi:hypothetical protein